MQVVNLTRAITKAIADLNAIGDFNGLELYELETASEESKRQDCIGDGRSSEWTDSYIADYACCCFYFGDPCEVSDCSPYTMVEFDSLKV